MKRIYHVNKDVRTHFNDEKQIVFVQNCLTEWEAESMNENDFH